MNKARLRWHCRRGMLELDLLLIPFFDAEYDQLPIAQQQAFEQLLTHTDPELLAWLMEKDVVSDPNLQTIVAVIIRYVKQQSV